MEDRINYPGWDVVKAVGAGSFGKVYEIKKDSPFGNTEHSALKVISFPPSPDYLQSYYDELGLDEESVKTLITSGVEDITKEINLMSSLKGNSNIVSYEDYNVVPHTADPGYDIYIRMELLTPLAQYLREWFPNTELPVDDGCVIALGQDICAALELCEKNSILHRDIKPQNIFINKDGRFKLGDFGIAKTSDHTTQGTKAGTKAYVAPEVYSGRPYNSQVDIYSLGLVMYWMLNCRRFPFMPLPPEAPTQQDTVEAFERRIAGEPVPPPMGGSQELRRIVLRAVAFDPAQRYASAAEMKWDLDLLASAWSAPPASEPDPDPDLPPEGIAAGYDPAAPTQIVRAKKPGRKKLLIAAGAAAAVLIVIVLAALLGGGSGGKPSKSTSSGGAVTEKKELLPLPAQALTGEKRVKTKGSTFTTRKVDGEDREMTLLPVAVTVSPDRPDIMRLTFVDKYDYAYTVYGQYAVDGDRLTVSPCDLLPDAGEGEYALEEPLEFTVAAAPPGYRLSIDGSSVTLLDTYYLDTGDVLVSGALSDGEEAYKEIQSFELAYNEYGKVDKCRITYTDGGFTEDAVPSTTYANIGAVSVSWTVATREYNGRMEQDNTKRSMMLDYINCYPYGFCFYDDTTGQVWQYLGTVAGEE